MGFLLLSGLALVVGLVACWPAVWCVVGSLACGGSCPAVTSCGAVWGKIKPRYYGGASLVVVFNYLILIPFFPASMLHKWRILLNA